MNNFILYLLFIIKYTNAYLENFKFLEGTWTLRSTNDFKLKNKFSYLVLENNFLKIKTITDGILRTKVSRTCSLKMLKNNNSLLKFINLNNLNNVYEDNNIDFELNISNVNIYSYSIFNLEIPQIRYKQYDDYNIKKIINVKHKDKTIYVEDIYNNLYYIFDLNNNYIKTPYIEITIATLLVNEIFDIILERIFR